MISAKVKINIDKNATQDILQKLDQGLDDLIALGFFVSQGRCPVDQGGLKESGHIEREFLKKKIIYDAPHSLVLEYGARAHFAPYQPIEDWVRRKRADFGITEKEIPKVARAIWMKIAKEGTEEHPYIRPALDEMKIKAKEIIERRLQG